MPDPNTPITNPEKFLAMKFLACLMTTLMMVSFSSVNAKGEPDKKEAEREQKRKEREEWRNAINDFLREKDANKDGSVKKDEYLAGETDQEAATAKFDKFDKNRDRSLTKTEIAEMLGLKKGE